MPATGPAVSRVILDVGQYPVLQQTRCKILRNRGYMVVEVGSETEFSEQLTNGEFDLALLCDSLPLGKQRKMALLIEECRPLTPVLVLAPGVVAQHDFGTMTVPNEPQRLLAAIEKLLKEPQSAS